MNYIGLINRFWQCNTEHPFSAHESQLYFYLLHTCNQLGWKMPFGHSDRHLSAMTGMSVPTVRQCKNRLAQRGLITVIIPDTKSKSFEGQTRFSFPSTVQPDCTVPFTDGYTDTCTVPFTDPLTNIKQDKTKLDNNNTPTPFIENHFSENLDFEIEKNESTILKTTESEIKRKKVPQKKEKDFSHFVLPFTSQAFTDAWNMLLQMPKWKKKGASSLQMVLKKLSAFEEEFSINLIELAISNNWQGLVFSDTDAKYQQWKLNKNQNQHGNKTTSQKSAAITGNNVETCPPARNYKERF